MRYRLLTTCIVSALHPNEPAATGTVWEPTNVIDVQEAEALVQMKLAEQHTTTKTDKVTPTWLQRQDEARRKKAETEAVVEPGDTDASTDIGMTDEELELVLDGNVEQVEAELAGLTVEQLRRLDEIEGAEEGAQRKGVHLAIAKAIAAAEATE